MPTQEGHITDDLQGSLDAYCAGAFPARQGVQGTALVEIRAGRESDRYSVSVESGPAGACQCEELILRIYPEEDAHAKSASLSNRVLDLDHALSMPTCQYGKKTSILHM